MNDHHFNNKSDEVDLLTSAMDALSGEVPLQYTIDFPELTGDQGVDFIANVTIGGATQAWGIQIKKRLTQAAELIAYINRFEGRQSCVLITEYVSPEAATRLKNKGIQFIDTAGNAFLNQPPLFLFVKGNKIDRANPAPQVSRVFKGAGLKLIYILLCRPDLADRPYRDLAAMADVSLGTVNDAMLELTQKNFILGMGRHGKRLVNAKGLFERWTSAYCDYLKPKLLLGSFRQEADWWRITDLDRSIAQWGGEVAAAKLTGYLKPETVDIYVDKERLTELVIHNRLRKDPAGKVKIYERFWPSLENGFGEGDIVDPILVYSDLAAIGDERTMETARMIYDQHLAGRF